MGEVIGGEPTYSEWRDKVDRLTAGVADLTRRLTEAHEGTRAEAVEVQRLTAENARLRTKLSLAMQKAPELCALEQENARLEKQVHDQANELVRVDAENARLRAEVEAAAIHKRVHMETIRGMNETCNALRAQLAAVTEQRDELAVAWDQSIKELAALGAKP